MHFAQEKYITVRTSSFAHFVSMVTIVQFIWNMGMLPVPANILTTSQHEYHSNVHHSTSAESVTRMATKWKLHL
jgi:hypothetical protein